MTIFGLSGTNWQNNITSDLSQIAATAAYWQGNTARLQISPLLWNANTPGYQAAVENEISHARANRLNVIISAQYEHTDSSIQFVPVPNASTVQFWQSIAPLYANDDHVWFELFNEPAYSTWTVWQNGQSGKSGIVGMQQLVNTIRAVAPYNIIIAEGPQGGKTLNGILPYLLTGGNIVYAVHPYFDPNTTATFTVPNTTASGWSYNWGSLTNQIPILVSEWGEADGSGAACATNAPKLVPLFLNYVKAHNIGLIGWALIPGQMIRGTNLEDPTNFDPGVAITCAGDATDPNAQGSGTDVRALFLSSTNQTAAAANASTTTDFSGWISNAFSSIVSFFEHL
jgi:hypothetical protein